MEWAIGYIVKNFVKKRDIIIVGQGYNLLKWLPFIKTETDISRTVKNLESVIEKLKDYIIICDDKYAEHETRLKKLGFQEIFDYYNWTKYARTNGHIPVDVDYNGVQIGYGSYFPYTKNNMKHIGRIGRFCSIADSVIIQGNHSMNRITTSSLYPMISSESKRKVESSKSDKDPLGTNRKVSIGSDVWIGADVFINASKCSKIGHGAIVGAGSIVMEDVPPYAVVYGSPAKLKRFRFSPEQIEILLKTKWWNWDTASLNKNIELLMDPDMFFEKYKRC